MRKRKPRDPNRHISSMIRKLKVKPGDVLLVNRASKYAPTDVLDALVEQFEKIYGFPCLFMVVDDFTDISKADDQVMMDNGWIRWPRGRKKK